MNNTFAIKFNTPEDVVEFRKLVDKLTDVMLLYVLTGNQIINPRDTSVLYKADITQPMKLRVISDDLYASSIVHQYFEDYIVRK